MIIYFSGTGNSYAVARELGALTQDQVIPLDKKNWEAIGLLLQSAKSVGLVFPVYFGDVPKPVLKFLKKATLSPQAYYYAAATCGSTQGSALYRVQELLGAKGCKLSYGRVVPMIANSTSTWKVGVTYDYSKLEKAKQLVEAMGQDILARKVDRSQVKKSLAGTLMAIPLVRKLGKKRFAISARPKDCVGCGLCVRLCPMGNLSLKDGKVKVHDHCAYCMACVQFCPHGGIAVHGHVIAKADQYHHPEVQAQELFHR